MFDRQDVEITAPLPAWPTAWGEERLPLALRLALVGFSAMLLIGIYYLVRYLTNPEEWFNTLLGVAMVALTLPALILLAPLLKLRSTRLPPSLMRGPHDRSEPGLTLVFKASWRPALGVCLCAVVLAMLLRMQVSVTCLRSPVCTVDRPLAWLSVIVTSAILALCAFSAIYLILFMRRRSYLKIDDRGLTLSVGRRIRRVAWDEIGMVSPRWESNLPTIRMSPASGRSFDPGDGRANRMDWYRNYFVSRLDVHPWIVGVDPVILLRMIRYYWLTPDARSELQDGRAAARIRAVELEVA